MRVNFIRISVLMAIIGLIGVLLWIYQKQYFKPHHPLHHTKEKSNLSFWKSKSIAEWQKLNNLHLYQPTAESSQQMLAYLQQFPDREAQSKWLVDMPSAWKWEWAAMLPHRQRAQQWINELRTFPPLDVARQKICKREKAIFVDRVTLDCTDVKNEHLASFTHLDTLVLSRNSNFILRRLHSQKWPTIRFLSIASSGHHYPDLSLLTAMPNVKSLALYLNNQGPLNLRTLQPSRQINRLSLQLNGSISSLEGIEKWQNLRKLRIQIHNPEFCCLKGVEKLKNLKELTILTTNDWNKELDMTGLRQLTSLQKLDISKLPQTLNTDTLGSLTDLQSLHLHSITNIDKLQDIATLQELEIQQITAKQLQDIPLIQKLQSLSLGSSGTISLAPLAQLPELTDLSLTLKENALVKDIVSPKNLRTLRIQSSSPQRLDDVVLLENLSSLQIHSPLQEPTALMIGRLKKLNHLDLQVHENSAISGLQDLNQLRHLKLQAVDEKTSMASYLQAVSSLESLDITSSSLNTMDLQHIAKMQQLQLLRLDLQNNQDIALSPLQSVIEKTALYIHSKNPDIHQQKLQLQLQLQREHQARINQLGRDQDNKIITKPPPVDRTKSCAEQCNQGGPLSKLACVNRCQEHNQ